MRSKIISQLGRVGSKKQLAKKHTGFVDKYQKLVDQYIDWAINVFGWLVGPWGCHNKYSELVDQP